MNKKFVFFVATWFCLLLLVAVYTRDTNREAFIEGWDGDVAYENEGPRPWQRYAVHQSLLADPIIKYKNAYYYELSNAEYERALKNIFKLHCSRLDIAMSQSAWSSPIKPSDVPLDLRGAYDVWVERLKGHVSTSPDLRVPGSSDVQIVHDRWIQAFLHAFIPRTIRMDIEVILYRSGKPHGKHVTMSVVAQIPEQNTAWSFDVPAIEVVGIIPEDQIALFPVLARNPFEQKQVKFTSDPASFGNTIVSDNDAVIAMIKHHNDLHQKFGETASLLGI